MNFFDSLFTLASLFNLAGPDLIILGFIAFIIAIPIWIWRASRKQAAKLDIGTSSRGQIFRKLLWRATWRSFLFVMGPGILLSFGASSAEAAGGVIGGFMSFYILLYVWLLASTWGATVKRFKQVAATTVQSAPPPIPPPRNSTLEVARAIDDRFVPPPPPAPPSRSAGVLASAQSFFIFLTNEVKGPFSTEQLKALITVGTITLDTQCCKQGTDEWFAVRNLL